MVSTWLNNLSILLETYIMKNYYLTTTLPYVNAKPHIGFALEIIQADAIVRYQRMLGKDVFYNTGTDEHGQKIHTKSVEAGLPTQEYVDGFAETFKELVPLLNLADPTFIRTTDTKHMAAAQEMWKRCEANGDIYKKLYQIKYCVGCELEKTDSELVDDKCPIHPTYEIEMIDEENYFFRFSNYGDKLLALYEKYDDFVLPKHRQSEIRAFVERGLQDFSISRLKEKMPWGVPVPGDDTQVMYVWFDALTNYISTLDWPQESETFEKFWGNSDEPRAVQVAGKDNLRQQTAMWQAMLMSAQLPTSRQVFIHGFITSGGQKMSKSIGNVIDPYGEVEKYGTDPLRYFLLGALPSDEDGDYTHERFEEFYTAHLANGVGNLTSRTVTMLHKFGDGNVPAVAEDCFGIAEYYTRWKAALEGFQFEAAVKVTQELVSAMDEKISEEKPWEKAKAGEDVKPLLYQLAEALRHVAIMHLPLVPASAGKMLAALGLEVNNLDQLDEASVWGGLAEGTVTVKPEPLFGRLEK